MADILQMILSNAFFPLKHLQFFYQKFIEICPLGSKWQEFSIGSGYGLALNRHMVSLGHSELTTDILVIRFTSTVKSLI